MTTPTKDKSKSRFAWTSFRFRIRQLKEVQSILQEAKGKTIQDFDFFLKPESNEKGQIEQIWPGHSFVRVEIEEGKIKNDVKDFLLQIRDLIYINNFQGTYNGNDPVLFSDRHVERLRNQIKEQREVEVVQKEGVSDPDAVFNVGDLVTILSGVFRGNEGEIVQVDSENKLLFINAEFFGRITTIELPFKDCKKFN